MTINEELIPTLKRLQDMDEVDKICYAHFRNTGQLLKPNNSAGIMELLALHGFPGYADDEGELIAALRGGDFERVSRMVFSENWMFPDDRDIILSKSVRYCKTNEHQHDYFEIECVLCGKALHYIDGKEVSIGSGDVIIVPPYMPHDLLIVEDGTVVNIGIRKSTFHKAFRQFLEDSLPLSQYFVQTLYNDRFQNSIILHCEEDLFWFETLLWLYKQNIEKLQYSKQIINRLTQAGLYYIMQRYAPEQSIISNQLLSNRMDEIFRYIDKNHQSVTLRAVAKEFGLSVPYLSSAIKSYFGKTYSALLRSVRLRHACELLANTNMRIVDVCYSVGYSEDSHFIQIFKKEFGVTPKQYQISSKLG